MITGYYEEVTDLLEDAKKYGAYTCICKPLEITDVLRVLDEILEKKRC